MRAKTRFAWSAVSVALLASGARALPQPAYATGAPDAGPVVDTLDRYGGRAPGSSAPAAAATASEAGSTRFLTWAGKPSAPSAVAAQGSIPAPSRAAQTASASTLWRPPAPAVGARPTIYDAPPAGAAAVSQMNPTPGPPIAAARRQTDGGPRFYSVHRDYGIEPDAIPLAPQFFGPTADLSEPPSDPLVKHVTSASGQTRTVAVAGGDQTSP